MSDGYEDYNEYGDYEDIDDFAEPAPIEDNVNTTTKPLYEKKKSMMFVTISDIKALIDSKCDEINELLGLSRDEALILYQYFQWRKDRVESEWFGNEDEIRKKAGLDPVNKADEDLSPERPCPMCFDTKPKEEFESLACNHYICKDCIAEYIDYQVRHQTA